MGIKGCVPVAVSSPSTAAPTDDTESYGIALDLEGRPYLCERQLWHVDWRDLVGGRLSPDLQTTQGLKPQQQLHIGPLKHSNIRICGFVSVFRKPLIGFEIGLQGDTLLQISKVTNFKLGNELL